MYTMTPSELHSITLFIANLTPPLDNLDKEEREAFVVTKINSIVTRRGNKELKLKNFFNEYPSDSGTDEISTDEKVRKASRSFRQTFDVSPLERLVNCKTYYSKNCPFNNQLLCRLFLCLSYK